MNFSNQGAPSPRYLVPRHARRLRRTKSFDKLLKGQQRIRSFLIPGLQGGQHNISVEQPIAANGETDNLKASQDFFVDSPQFVLPDNEVQSVYPPQGHEETVETLPHVTLNSPTFPWEWVASLDKTTTGDYMRNRVPWLAVLVFTKEELQLSSQDLRGPNSIFRNTSIGQNATQTPNLAVNMPISEVEKLVDTATPIKKPPPTSHEAQASSDIIFLSKSLFSDLFTRYDKNGKPETYISPTDKKSAPYVLHHRYLAHYREINAEGMAVSSKTATEDDQKSIGLVVAHRTGPLSITQPTTCYVHLVSIKGVEGMRPWPIEPPNRLVAMPSLYSWSYTCLPPDTLTVEEKFELLGKSCANLKVVLDPKDRDAVLPLVLDRLDDGYSLLRYRVQTGESTACFMRGPFIPVQSSDTPKRTWKSISKDGGDLQILDKQAGLMDISYSSSWQIGRTLAIADQAFVASLGKIRHEILERAQHQAQLEVLGDHGFKSVEGLIQDLPQLVERLHGLPKVNPDQGSRLRRWHRPAVEPVDISYSGIQRNSDLNDQFKANFIDAALDVASAMDTKNPGTPTNIPYNEFNTPFSADWMVVLKWINDMLFLSNIPSQYLITDSSYLPRETIRFFHVDWRWTDALIDGAISLANHIDRADDQVRDGIWAAIKRYQETHITELKNTPPPFPQYGCYIRSKLVTEFPDLRVELRNTSNPGEDPPVLLRHDILNTETMLCLFSHAPSASYSTELSFTQPSHQQAFSAGIKLNQSVLKMLYKKSYTTAPGPDPQKSIDDPQWEPNVRDPSHPAVYLWTSPSSPAELRTLLMDNFAADYLSVVQKKMGDYFKDNTATSALMARQLSSPCWRLPITVSKTGHFVPETLEAVHQDDVDLELHQAPLGSGSNQPDFQYVFFSTDANHRSTAPMLKVEQDLIIGINLEDNSAYDWDLKSITISIPLGNKGNEPTPLAQTFAGPDPVMLSNYRFNSIADITGDEDDGKLVLRLLPRSSNGYVPVRLCRELSFMVSGVFVHHFDTDTEIAFEVEELYRHMAEPVHPVNVPPTITLVKED